MDLGSSLHLLSMLRERPRPEYAVLFNEACQLYRTGLFAKAEEYFLSSLEANNVGVAGDTPVFEDEEMARRAYLMLGRLYAQDGARQGSAVFSYQQAAKGGAPVRVEACVEMAYLFLANGERNLASASFSNAYATFKNSKFGWFARRKWRNRLLSLEQEVNA